MSLPARGERAGTHLDVGPPPLIYRVRVEVLRELHGARRPLGEASGTMSSLARAGEGERATRVGGAVGGAGCRCRACARLGCSCGCF